MHIIPLSFGSLLVVLKMACFVGDETSMQTWRWTELLQMLEVTAGIISSHNKVGSQALGKGRRRLVNVFLWQHFPGGLPGDFQFICRLKLWLEFMVLSQHGSP